ncbi:MAG: hypothetical protein BWX80_01498 [Candidatus Hydrogenedentes bacterium ADurb.Bin101]|nr:MAG: hypothetical protein BWX80_01498 [Candidatus Hydrogenedentes bacterium ADurb.Bin101]
MAMYCPEQMVFFNEACREGRLAFESSLPHFGGNEVHAKSLIDFSLSGTRHGRTVFPKQTVFIKFEPSFPGPVPQQRYMRLVA